MAAPPKATVSVGRYELHGEIAAGGTATVHVGRLRGDAGFSRTVAIKRLHPSLARDPDFGAMLVDEARLSARIRHPNVVAVLDVVALAGELLLVMDLVEGESLARLVRKDGTAKERVPPAIAAAILVDALHGLHAAHEARDEEGQPLGIVHRDVSPQNIMVGRDGVSRIVDFGIAKAAARAQITREGVLKGKYAYMAPEQLAGLVGAPPGLMDVTRRTDIYAAGIVLWESLVGRRLFEADDEAALLGKVAAARITPPGLLVAEAMALEAVTMKALARDAADRFATAAEMADAIERALPPARRPEIVAWVDTHARAVLDERAAMVLAAEKGAPVVAEIEPQLVTQIEAPPLGRNRGRSALPIALLGLALFAGMAWWLSRAPSPPATSPAEVTSNAPVASSTPVPAPSPSPSPTPSPVPCVAPSMPSAKTAQPTSKPIATAVKPASTCDPPWTIDAQGKKIFRVECL